MFSPLPSEQTFFWEDNNSSCSLARQIPSAVSAAVGSLLHFEQDFAS
jgi:hypothetical protein